MDDQAKRLRPLELEAGDLRRDAEFPRDQDGDCGFTALGAAVDDSSHGRRRREQLSGELRRLAEEALPLGIVRFGIACACRLSAATATSAATAAASRVEWLSQRSAAEIRAERLAASGWMAAAPRSAIGRMLVPACWMKTSLAAASRLIELMSPRVSAGMGVAILCFGISRVRVSPRIALTKDSLLIGLREFGRTAHHHLERRPMLSELTYRPTVHPP